MTRTGAGADRVVALALFVAVVGSLLATEGREGFGRDEGQYMRAGERYWGWFEELGRNVRERHPGRSFTTAAIDRYWSDNAPDHPVVMKTLFGLSWRAFHRCRCTGPTRGLHPVPVVGRHITLPLFRRESTAFRFPAILMAGMLAVLVFRFARRLVPRSAAAAGAVLAIAQPHYFFHAPIACFDAPITTMAFAVGFAYWKSLRSARWGVACGLIFGVALGVKHNAWLMPIFLAGHYLRMRRGDWRRLRPPRIPLAFVSMAVLGPVVFLLHWPWLWHHPLDRTRTYLNRHLQHEHYNFEYLGRNWNLPPTDRDLKLERTTFPFVSTALTVPVTTLGLAVLGALALARRRGRRGDDGAAVDTVHGDTHAHAHGHDHDVVDEAMPFSDGGDRAERHGKPGTTRAADADPSGPRDRSPSRARVSWLRPGADVDAAPGAFIAVQIFGPLSVLALPSTPIFGGVKHFMPAMPYLAVSAACGLAWVAARLGAALRERARPRLALPATLALTALACAPALAETRRSHPDGLSHYNMIAGGFAGGASLGMNRQFWAYCVLPVLDWVNRHEGDNQRMYWHDVIGDALAMYKREGRLSLAVGDTGYGQPGVARSTMGLMVYERHWALFEKYFWDEYGTLRPTLVRSREGVPLVIGYERPRK